MTGAFLKNIIYWICITVNQQMWIVSKYSEVNRIINLWKHFWIDKKHNKRNKQTFSSTNMVQVSFKDLDTKSDKDSSLLKNVVKFMWVKLRRKIIVCEQNVSINYFFFRQEHYQTIRRTNNGYVPRKWKA